MSAVVDALTASEREAGYVELWRARVREESGAERDLRIIVRRDYEVLSGWVAETCGSPCSSRGHKGLDATGAVFASLEWSMFHARWRLVSVTAAKAVPHG